MKPFLRWAGGKQRLVANILNYVPNNHKGHPYFEPFLGGGALFWALEPKEAYLSDLNEPLIQCYEKIRDNPYSFIAAIREHQRNSSKDYYYKIREEYNANLIRNSVAQAARFYYLNRTSFNGIYRVNQKGLYNVPYDAHKNIVIPSLEEIKRFSDCLKRAKIAVGDFKAILDKVHEGDFVYLDPPYPPLNGTAYFSHYTKDRFDDRAQEEVASFASVLSAKGARVLISNADTEAIRTLYPINKWKRVILSVTRVISCKSVRKKVNELLFYNY